MNLKSLFDVITLIVLSRIVALDMVFGSKIQPKFKHIVPLPPNITHIDFMPQISFDYSTNKEAKLPTAWQMNGAQLSDTGLRLVEPGAQRRYGVAHSEQALSAMASDWRVDMKVLLRYKAQSPPGWFGFIISTSEIKYNFDDPAFGNMVGVAFFARLQSDGTFIIAYSTDKTSPTEMTPIPGKKPTIESQETCGPPGVRVDDTVISSFTMLIQSIEDKVTVALVPEGAKNTMFMCFENAKIPDLSEVTQTGQAHVDLVGVQGGDGGNEVTVSQLRFFKYQFNQDFPIPSLTDGNIYPQVRMIDILECSSIVPEVKSPDYDTRIFALFKVERLVGIDAIQGAIDLFASLYLQWEVKACSRNTTAPNAKTLERLTVPPGTRMWRPKLLLTNSSNDVFMEQGSFGESFQIMFAPTEPNRTLYFHWIRLGIFSSRCHLHLKYFPFDKQQCDFTFMIEEPIAFVQFGGVKLHGNSLYYSDRWIFEGYHESFGITSSVSRRSGLASFARLQLNFARDPTHYIVNLLVPCYILVMLVFGSFLMKPEIPERSAFCGMILLTLTVAQSDVLGAVPQTSQRIVFAENILMMTSLAGCITLYDMAMCSFHKIHEITYHFKCFSLRLVRFFDMIMFIVAFTVVLSVNLYSSLIGRRVEV